MKRDDTAPTPLAERRRVMLMVDLAGFTRAVAGLGPIDLAALVHRFYCLAGDAIESAGGTVVKFVGDGCLSVFDETDAVAAVACARDMQAPVHALGREFSVDLEVGANVHLSIVVEGDYGGGASRARDIVGPGVIHTYRMGAGEGIRISEPVYRKLPNDQRGAWTKRQPPATYTLSG
jgi:adenylate cyclase